MSSRPWSLQRRTALQFAAVATLFLVVSGMGVSLVHRMMIARGLDEELFEQLDELRETWPARSGGRDDFERLAAPLGRDDAETPLACLALVQESGEQWGPFGPERLVALLDEDQARSGELVRLDGGLRVHRSELEPGIAILVALDGADWMGRIRLFELVVSTIVLSGSLLSLFAGRIFGRRVAALLERVAVEVEDRDARVTSDAPLEVPGAPLEIRAVVQAIETTLRQTRGEVERAQVLAAGLAHDLRAPVQSLLTSTQVSLLEPPAQTDVRLLLEEHLSELRVLARTIDNLVAWGSPRLADVEVRGEPRVTLDLGSELEARLKAEEEEAARRGVFLDMQRSGDLSLTCDPGALILAVRNLVGNAIVWSPDGGNVLVRLTGFEREVEIGVEDEGPGVPEPERERVFQPFVRGATAPGRRAGYGLGLAIVAYVAERHAGSVHVEDSASGGARFVLRVPRGAEDGRAGSRLAGDRGGPGEALELPPA